MRRQYFHNLRRVREKKCNPRTGARDLGCMRRTIPGPHPILRKTSGTRQVRAYPSAANHNWWPMESLFYPASGVFFFPRRRISPCFNCTEKPSSRLMTVISYISVSNRRKVMSGKAAKIRLTEGQTAILQQIIRSMTAPQRLVQRARLIVLAFGGMFNGLISGIIGLRRKQVGLWRRRWKQSFNALVAIECRESRAALRRAIEEVLGDAPRSGSFGKFTAEQVTQVLAVACEPADQSGRPIDEWTGRELADELVQRGIVASISASQVNRYLAAAELQPHRSKYWLTPRRKTRNYSRTNSRSSASAIWRPRNCTSSTTRTRSAWTK